MLYPRFAPNVVIASKRCHLLSRRMSRYSLQTRISHFIALQQDCQHPSLLVLVRVALKDDNTSNAMGHHVVTHLCNIELLRAFRRCAPSRFGNNVLQNRCGWCGAPLLSTPFGRKILTKLVFDWTVYTFCTISSINSSPRYLGIHPTISLTLLCHAS